MLQEVTLKKAMQLSGQGKVLTVLVPLGGENYKMVPLMEMFDGCRIFQEVVEVDNSASSTPPEKTKKAPAKKKVDVGKIHALHKAGWTMTKIADEMKVSVQTVSNYLKQDWKPNEEGGGKIDLGCDVEDGERAGDNSEAVFLGR